MSAEPPTRPRRHRRRVVALGLLAGSVGLAGGALALSAVGPAEVSTSAQRGATITNDVAAVYDQEAVDAPVVAASFRIAEQIGATAATARNGSIGMQRVARGGATVHAPPAGYLIPTIYLGMNSSAIAGMYGYEISGLLNAGNMVLDQITADLTGARVGDVFELRATDGSTQGFTVAAILPHEVIGGSEMIMTTEAVSRLGVVEDTRTVIWNIQSRPAFDNAVAAEGLESRANTRVSRSWNAPDPDDTLSTARTKQLLGEPWYRLTSETTIAMHPDWIATNLTAGRVLLSSAVPIRAQCHVRIVGDLSAALNEVAAAGLGGAIEVSNANTYGGCYNPRYARFGGFLSRHAYGQALDTNTVSNCQGCVPRMDCRVVRIFRKHGFAWGGNFRTPDGMHFEWVGERRDLVQYPSKYCSNLPGGVAATESVGDGPSLPLPPDELGVGVLTEGFSDDAHDH